MVIPKDLDPPLAITASGGTFQFGIQKVLMVYQDLILQKQQVIQLQQDLCK